MENTNGNNQILYTDFRDSNTDSFNKQYHLRKIVCKMTKIMRKINYTIIKIK
jgi:hypothetical protein